MPDVSYLITYRKTDSNRHAVLNYILQALASQEKLEVILVEQDKKAYCDTATLPANCRYLFVENDKLFNRSWGFNLAAEMALTEFLIAADADMLLTHECLEETINELGCGVDAVNPYTTLIDLDAEETAALLKHQNTLSIKRTQSQTNRLERRQTLCYCGGVFALTAELFARTGGFDERFQGWGAEDDAMSMRISHFAHKPVTLEGHTAFHLWHKPATELANYEPHYLRNLALLSAYYEYGDDFYTHLAHTDVTAKASPDKYSQKPHIFNSAGQQPLVSCLCVTRGRPETLKQAIACFKRQTHANTELIIVCENHDSPTLQYLSAHSDPAIKLHIIASQPKLTLGQLRNKAVEVASGEYVCQWDDDDWYHPRRVELQLKSALEQNRPASIMPRWLIYSYEENKAYCSNVRLWEGSLLCKKSVLLAGPGYPAQSKDKDTPVISWLYVHDQLAIDDRPDLYVYMHRCTNTRDQQHFQKILKFSTPLNAEHTGYLQKMLNDSMQEK